VNKYRLKLKNSRIIGPLSTKDIFKLFESGQISGDEECQLFPSGDWKSIESFPDIVEGITNQNFSNADQTVANMKLRSKVGKQVQKEKKEKHIEKIKQLDEEIKNKEFVEFKFDKEKVVEPEITIIEEDEIADEDEEDEKINKTRVINIKKDLQDVDKTRVVRINKFKDKPVEETPDEVVDEQPEEPVEIEEVISQDDATRVTNLNDLLPALNQEIEDSEVALIQEEEALQPAKTNSKKKSKKNQDSEQEVKKKKIKPLVAVSIILLLYYLLFLDEPPKKVEPRFLIIQSPVSKQVEDPRAAANSFKKGLEVYKKYDYKSKLMAASYFKESLEYQYANNEALNYLILVYSELLPNVKNQSEAKQIIFKFIQMTQSKRYKNPEVALGTALFFRNSGKIRTALMMLENYLRLSKPTLRVMATYLDLLIDVGDLESSRSLVEKVDNVAKKPLDLIISLARFHNLNEDRAKAEETLKEGLKFYPNSVEILLLLSDYLWNGGNFVKYKSVLQAIDQLGSEGSPFFYSKYLEQMGMLSVYNKDNKTAAVLFAKALQIRESDRLRSKLAELQVGGSKLEEGLILESKMIDLIDKASNAESKLNWDLAFKYAIEAADMSETYIPAKLYLSSLQIKRGYFESAIETLVRLRKQYPTNIKVNYNLINAYIESFKLNEADKEILIIKNMPEINESKEFASLLGRYYLKSGNILNAVKWLQESLRRDPLNDEDYALLAATYLKYRKYDQAKYQLTKAIELDPRNLNYLTSYSKILFELDGADVAIGYLRKYLEDFPDEPKLLGEIAIYNYKNGQIKEFEQIKKEVEQLNRKDPNFYSFLVSASILEENVDQVIAYSKKLVEVEPGNLEAKITLGNFLLKQKKYDEALAAYFTVTQRLSAYPQISYLIGKVYLQTGQADKALEYAKLEIQRNPALYNGYYLAGETFRRKEQYPDAVKMLEKAISIDGKAVEALLSLADIKFRQNYLDAAREMAMRSVRLEPNNPQIRRLLGLIYVKIGQGSLAQDELNTYLKLDPGAPDRAQIERTLNNIKR